MVSATGACIDIGGTGVPSLPVFMFVFPSFTFSVSSEFCLNADVFFKLGLIQRMGQCRNIHEEPPTLPNQDHGPATSDRTTLMLMLNQGSLSSSKARLTKMRFFVNAQIVGA
jgi:hypothetical protein